MPRPKLMQQRFIGLTLAVTGYFALAVGMWGVQSDRLQLSADSTRKEATITFQSERDWKRGVFENAVYADGSVQINEIAPNESTQVVNTSSNTPEPPAQSTTKQTPSKTVLESGGIALQQKSSLSCRSLAPKSGWIFLGSSQGNTADLYELYGKAYAGYGIQPINTQLQSFANAYQAPLNNPELYSEDPATVAKAYGQIITQTSTALAERDSSSLNFTSEYNEQLGAYTLRSVESTKYRGVIFFHREGFAGDGINYSYALPMYFALTKKSEWDKYGEVTARMAASIRCTTQLIPSNQNVGSGGSAAETSTSDQNGSADGYNPWLETEYVHDENGTNYLVSPSDSWSSTGPDGQGGYYLSKGGSDYERLQPGRVD